jgi:hypothetical protein
MRQKFWYYEPWLTHCTMKKCMKYHLDKQQYLTYLIMYFFTFFLFVISSTLYRLEEYYSCPSTFVCTRWGRGHGELEVVLHSFLVSYLDKSSGWFYGTVTLSLGKRPWYPLDWRLGEHQRQPEAVQKRKTLLLLEIKPLFPYHAACSLVIVPSEPPELITNFMEERLSWEASSSSGSQEMAHTKPTT